MLRVPLLALLTPALQASATTVRALHSYFGLHDKAKFDIICFSSRAGDNSPERNSIVAGCNKGMVDISQLPFDEVRLMCSGDNHRFPACCRIMTIVSLRSPHGLPESHPRRRWRPVSERLESTCWSTSLATPSRRALKCLRCALLQCNCRLELTHLVARFPFQPSAPSVPWFPRHDGCKFH
jgi:hypothetical protein